MVPKFSEKLSSWSVSSNISSTTLALSAVIVLRALANLVE